MGGMGRIIATEHISLDGVVEAPGPGDIGDFPHKGWIFDFDRDEARDRYKLDEVLTAEVQLLGRVTYETMAAFWPEVDGPFAEKLNAMPKYVLSKTLERGDWTNSTVLRGDLVSEITRLRETVAGDILVYGSVQLVRGLLEHGLLDEVRPVDLPRAGRRACGCSARRPDMALELLDSRSTPNGVTLQVYRPTGRPRYAS